METNPTRTEAAAECTTTSADGGCVELAGLVDQAREDPSNGCITESSCIKVSLQEWGPRASDVGARLRISVSAVIRIALAEFLKEEVQEAMADIVVPGSEGVRSVNVNATSARRLTARARAAGMTQGMYLDALILGAPPPPLPADHAELRSALARSNDQLAVTLADLRGLTRQVGAGQVKQPMDCGASVESLIRDVRAHLVLAAQLLSELTPPRRKP